MKSWLPVAGAAAVMLLIPACGLPLLAPEDRKQVCDVTIVEKFDAPAFHANILASPAGGLAGAGGGALQGLVGGFPGAVVTVPLGALIGAVAGTTCAAGGMAHPTAETDFERILHVADAGALKRALEAEMNAPRAECRQTRTARPDAIIEIEKLDAGMGCPIGQQTYWIVVQWRTALAATGRQLNWTSTRCALTSSRTVDDWFADPGTARAEIETAFAAVGRRMAGLLLAQDMPYECALRSDAAGAVVAK